MLPESAKDERAEALADLIEAAAVLLARMVWSPEALPMAERLAAALNRVTEFAETDPTTEEDHAA